MAIPDHSIDPRILESAKKEFLAHGFEKTSLKTICENAGVTTGALYKRYKGKEDLFCAVVVDTLEDLKSIAAEKGGRDVKAMSDDELVKAWDMEEDYMMWWFSFLYKRKEGFVLLLKCADGTRYSNFQHDWVEEMTNSTNAFLQEAYRRKLARVEISNEELHILLSAFWATIYEPFIHNYSWHQIEDHCKIVCRLFNWNKCLDFSCESS